ncbi:hypothetical protein N7478_008816 [Penicillium angulare]|uniref:uncharacterized protein n=1 Tax=Penicillium angulare TaxID=116970 RepID=UPI002541899F|nr:uncharacterized protein N7478_008816 [Penicillium angulare]KAJ5273691.1 hypothetical protein N7478_008816 [Penicillium angulare]
MPPGAWDSHMHVIDTFLYPLSATAICTPKAYTLDHATVFESPVNISNVVLIQPSIYVMTTPACWMLHTSSVLSMPGVSLHLTQLQTLSFAYAIWPLKWALQQYIPLHTMAILEGIVPQLQVSAYIDHFGNPLLPGQALYTQTRDPYTLPRFQALVKLLEEGNTVIFRHHTESASFLLRAI